MGEKTIPEMSSSGTLGRDGKLATVSAFGVIENPILPALFSIGLGQSTA
jgi:hypothetical protein